ncbi:protein SUPPRESSOR OF GENE SILENCING 3-like [Malania oleifera]|uniref:protein SUPPRESSOR OF GENE SILENCING 3-like n=1 Tax=Malania oleifera TaxID=397392 RepID=UPI0025AE3DF8|nr:protein SUPPRESSOR OF GENE SILENCING 3-like [Malania oleifera]XP_057978248.1 protein SUPPRESSOR OF GENE SILENCING 3-like [Malania oleifera]XP_057978249.1 protein SUPPRESSOR OF GENE SILENCING 3-like [Malania oleifera]
MMSSRREGGKPFNIGPNANLSLGGNYVSESPTVDQLSRGVADANLASSDDGEWEVCARKSKNRAGSSSAKACIPQNSNSKAWGHPDVIQKLGMCNDGPGKASGNTWPTQFADSKRPAGRGGLRPQSFNRGFENNHVAPPAVIPPPMVGGWNWSSRATAVQLKGSEDVRGKDVDDGGRDDDIDVGDDKDNDKDNDSDAIDDSDDDFFSDGFDSDTSQKSHETQKKNKWFKKFFEILDKLTVDEINEPARQWHCPACHGGPGAIDWYRGLQPLISHANTKRTKRVKLHRELAKILNEELSRKGTSVLLSGETFGKWKGLNQTTIKDYEIVWPPMVVVMNTKLEKDENDKWIGMGNQELLDYFSSYAAIKARHSYGPQGHRGMSVLIFEASAMGYLEAERLHKHFEEQGTDRNAWDRCRVLFYPGGKRQLYGYMAVKEDLTIFNQHSQGKSKLKFDMKSYQEMVVSQMKQMSEDNQQLILFKDKVVREQRRSKALEESFGIVTEKLRKTIEENRIVRQRTKMQHEQNKEEMDFQEQFFKDQITIIHDARDAKEDEFEKLQQEEREKVKQANANPSTIMDSMGRLEGVARFIQLQDKEMEEFVAERDRLIKIHEDKKVAMRRRHLKEQLELEKGFDADLTRLMEKYTPHH